MKQDQAPTGTTRRSGHSRLVYDKAKRTIIAVDPDCSRCRGGGCEWCSNTGKAMVLMPASDANDLDAVVHALRIEDSDTSPAEAVAELHAEIERLRARVKELEYAN